MQPESLQAPRSYEQVNQPASSHEIISPQYEQHETYPVAQPERFEQRSAIELAPPPPMMPPQVMPMPPVPQTAPVRVADDQAMQNPISANDDDNIEREWVDRAKQILVQTRSDPRAREKAIGALQRDYIFKRYGKRLGATSD